MRVTLATGIPEEVCRAANLGYLDPASVDPAAFAADPDTLVVPRAGEMLFRLALIRARARARRPPHHELHRQHQRLAAGAGPGGQRQHVADAGRAHLAHG